MPTHHTRRCTHLEQLLGVLAEAMRLAQVQGAKVCVEGLIQLQRAGSRGSGRWPSLPAAALSTAVQGCAHQFIINAVADAAGGYLGVLFAIWVPQEAHSIAPGDDLDGLETKSFQQYASGHPAEQATTQPAREPMMKATHIFEIVFHDSHGLGRQGRARPSCCSCYHKAIPRSMQPFEQGMK